MSVGIEVAIIDRLEAQSAVTNITSRVRAGHLLPSDAYPAVVVLADSEEPEDDLQGLTSNVYTTIRVRSFSEKYSEARDLDWACRFGVVTQTGTAAGLADFAGTVGSLTITEITWRGTTLSFDDPDDGKAAPLYEFASEYRVWAAAPT